LPRADAGVFVYLHHLAADFGFDTRAPKTRRCLRFVYHRREGSEHDFGASAFVQHERINRIGAKF